MCLAGGFLGCLGLRCGLPLGLGGLAGCLCLCLHLGGLLGQLGGGIGRSVGKATASVAFSFATTYALGQVAKRYYAVGRQMSTALLQETFQSLIQPAKTMQAQYLPQIRQKASTLDMGQIMALVKGR